MEFTKKVGVIGSGSFGRTVSKLLVLNSNVLLFTRNPSKVDLDLIYKSLDSDQREFTIELTSDIQYFCTQCQVIFPVIPTENARALAKSMSPHLTPAHYIIHCMKGLDYLDLETFAIEDIYTISQVFQQETNVIRIGCMSGPNLAIEIMENQPAGSVIASEFDEVIEIGKKLLTSKRFFVFGSHELLGTELAGAFKNIIAIGSGLLAGSGYGKNIQALLITRGLHEIIKLSTTLGANTSAFLGSAGIGDLIATATSDKSRNYRLGFKIAQGDSLEKAVNDLGEAVEGVRTLKTVKKMADALNIQIPISNMLYYIIHQEYPIERALDKLVFYPTKDDVEFK